MGIATTNQVLTWLLSSGGIYGILHYVLVKKLDARFSRELEKARHEMQLQLQKMSIVYEHQKDSFRNVLVAMNKALLAIESEWDDGEWGAIAEEEADAFRGVIVQERLFLDSSSDYAVQLFLEIMFSAVADRYSGPPDSPAVSRAHSQMKFILDHLADHFRGQVGLSSGDADPLFDILVLEACRLINSSHFAKFDFPTKSLLKAGDYGTSEALVSAAKENTELLRAELMRLKEAMTSSERKSSFYYRRLAAIDRCLIKLEGRYGTAVQRKAARDLS